MARPTQCPKDIVIGELRDTSRSGQYRVLSYEGTFKVLIQFENTKHKMYVHANHVRKNWCKDPMAPSVHGVGFLGDVYSSVTHPKIHAIWASMLGRCYSDDVQKRHPAYVGCTVCDEWHNFSNFVPWYLKNIKAGEHLDKDIKVKGNREYSPSTCLGISPKENIAHMSQREFCVQEEHTSDAVHGENLKRFCEEHGFNYKRTHRYKKLTR